MSLSNGAIKLNHIKRITKMKKKKVSILWSTWSIWVQTLEVVSEHSQQFEIYALCANSNINLIKEQIKQFKPKKVAIFNEQKANQLAIEIRNSKFEIPILSWMKWLIEIAKDDNSEILVTSVVWAIWLEPTIEALKKWKVIALANKETMVVAWEKINKLVKKYWWEIRPIDSEHSAIWQSLRSWKREEVKRVWLTASWWPFRDKKLWPKEKITKATAVEALNHPTWKMWAKITIDSASLANKWLEFIEAMYLFNLKPEQIEVVIHPQSIIHSAVEYNDWSIIAEMWATDMKRAISYTITWERREKNSFKTFSFFDKTFTFEHPDLERFPCLALAIKAAKTSQEACAIFNNVNEIAVNKFLKWEIGFYDISGMIKTALGNL